MAVESAKREYGKVVISLENVVLDHEKLIQTPSRIDGLNEEVEIDLRIVGCEFIQTAGILLKLPQVAMATGQVLFQRFYYSKSFVKHDAEVYAMACIFLAAKIEEAPRRVRDVINVFHHIKQKRNNRQFAFDQFSKCLKAFDEDFEKWLVRKKQAMHSSESVSPMEYLGNQYYNLKNLVIKAERRLLKELGFCVHVKHPHKIIITYLQILESEKNQELAQKAWNYMNDSLRSSVFVRYPPECIACACIFLSARQLEISLPLRPPWWDLFDAKLEDLENISRTLLELQMRPKASLDSLQKMVGEVQKTRQAQKLQNRQEENAGNSTPPTASSQPSSKPGSRTASPSKSVTQTSSPDQEDEGKKTAEKEEKSSANNNQRSTARGKQRSRSPDDRRSKSRSKSRSRSRSRSKSRSRSGSRSPSYSLSISPGSIGSRSDSESSNESPVRRRVPEREKRRRTPPREDRYRNRKRDNEVSQRDRKAFSSDSLNSYKRSRERRRSRSPFSPSRSRSRSRSRERTKRHRSGKYERDRQNREERRRGDRNGVDQREQEKRAHRRHRR